MWDNKDLLGTKNDSNVEFTLDGTPKAGTLLITFNGNTLYEVVSSPGPNQYARDGLNITLGLAPREEDDVWGQADWE